jgi:hypothetical protein
MTASPPLNGHKRPTTPAAGDWRPDEEQRTPSRRDESEKIAVPIGSMPARIVLKSAKKPAGTPSTSASSRSRNSEPSWS